MRINDFAEVQNVMESDNVLIDTASGTYRITMDAIKDFIGDPTPPKEEATNGDVESLIGVKDDERVKVDIKNLPERTPSNYSDTLLVNAKKTYLLLEDDTVDGGYKKISLWDLIQLFSNEVGNFLIGDPVNNIVTSLVGVSSPNNTSDLIKMDMSNTYDFDVNGITPYKIYVNGGQSIGGVIGLSSIEGMLKKVFICTTDFKYNAGHYFNLNASYIDQLNEFIYCLTVQIRLEYTTNTVTIIHPPCGSTPVTWCEKIMIDGNDITTTTSTKCYLPDIRFKFAESTEYTSEYVCRPSYVYRLAGTRLYIDASLSFIGYPTAMISVKPQISAKIATLEIFKK